ncbi:MAG: hypothetical protein EOO43_10150 [Flavobacterium sp.]|nr:MAG: hypothetical protein EOO43_10150 [Flavobacterium sp.]
MKTKTTTPTKSKTTTNYVMVTPELQLNNELVVKAYTKIVEVAIELLRKFEMQKYRTYIQIEHTLNPQNVNLIKEFVCHFYNITLSNAKDGRSFIFVEMDQNYINKFGGNLINRLLREAYKVTQSNDNTDGIEYCLKPQFVPTDVQNYFYRMTFNGETDIVSILIADRLEVN